VHAPKHTVRELSPRYIFIIMSSNPLLSVCMQPTRDVPLSAVPSVELSSVADPPLQCEVPVGALQHRHMLQGFRPPSVNPHGQSPMDSEPTHRLPSRQAQAAGRIGERWIEASFPFCEIVNQSIV